MSTALFIGRFQPFHNGHLQVIKEILEKNNHVIIVIGSAQEHGTDKNPLTAEERTKLILETLSHEKIPKEKYKIIPVNDLNDPPNWPAHVNKHVPKYEKIYTGSQFVKKCYKNLPKQNFQIIDIKKTLPVSATAVRKAMLKDKPWESLVPKPVADLCEKWDIPGRLKTSST